MYFPGHSTVGITLLSEHVLSCGLENELVERDNSIGIGFFLDLVHLRRCERPFLEEIRVAAQGIGIKEHVLKIILFIQKLG